MRKGERGLVGLLIFLVVMGFFAPTPALACTPIRGQLTTDLSYEQSVEPYYSISYREQVDTASYIATGTIKRSWGKAGLTFTVHKYLKTPDTFRSEKKIKIHIKEVDPSRISFSSSRDYYFGINTTKSRFWVSGELGIDGIYWPGDCSSSLKIYEGEEYLVFLDDNMVVISLMQVHENNDEFVSAVTSMVADSKEPYGHFVDFKKFIVTGALVQLLETDRCLPVPKYRILATTDPKNKTSEITGEPVKIIEEDASEPKWHLSEEEQKLASSKGLELGQFRNVPHASNCRIGKKYLSVGFISYTELSGHGGMFIPEENGYFDLSKTVYEHHFKPQKISSNDALSTIYATNQ